MKIEIKDCSDARHIAELNRDVQKLHEDIEPEIFKSYSVDSMEMFFREQMSKEGVFCYTAEIEGVPAGYIMLSVKNYPERYYKYSYPAVMIDHICVKEEYRGRNIGKLLIERVKMFAVEQGIRRIELDYWTKNANAGQFFLSQGFGNFNERMFMNI